jgi:NAD-dependent deacetylase
VTFNTHDEGDFMDAATIQQAAEMLQKAARIAVLTGAGVSQESGVPTFRDALTGLWAQYDPTQLGTPAAFRQNPKLVWEWFEFRRGLVRNAKPNPGHVAIAQLQQRSLDCTIITQNVDDLHEQAGAHDVLHVHGLIAETKCFFNCRGEPTLIDLATLPPSDDVPPLCPYCGRWLRPNVVWFTENLPRDVWAAAGDAALTCDVILVVGTSGLVEPAGGLPRVAKQRGAKIIEVNPIESVITPLADIWLDAPSGVALPRVIEAMN